MLRGIGVHREETFGWGRQDDRLGNDGSHGTLASSLESETPVSAGRSGARDYFLAYAREGRNENPPLLSEPRRRLVAFQSGSRRRSVKTAQVERKTPTPA
jgi:hypothetical protein